MAVINVENEMPESCSMCDHRTVCTVFGAGWANARNRYSLGVYSRQDDCPLKSVEGLIEGIQEELPKSYFFGNHSHTYLDEEDVIQFIKEYCGKEK